VHLKNSEQEYESIFQKVYNLITKTRSSNKLKLLDEMTELMIKAPIEG